MARKSDHLRAVEDGETATPEPPKTLAEAVELDRRSFLVRARLQIAETIDAGVPAHALGRLIAEAERLDVEVRRIDAQNDQEEAQKRGSGERRSFDAAAI